MNAWCTPAQVDQFIARFHESMDIDDVFTKGCCYWFAYILSQRFPYAEIMYDQVANHFAVNINSHLYDITGCVDGQYSMIPWKDFDDDLEEKRIIRDCIMF